MRQHHLKIGSVVLALVAWAGSTPGAAAAGGDAVVVEYSVRSRGAASDLETFAAAAAETYADPRGWNLRGAMRFERVEKGGDFTLWLAADRLMPTFGGACGTDWSCRNGDDVVINETRWLNASPAWNAAGASLRDYRHMVLNHETGHWLRFGHAMCGAPGAAAPVMQQQSMGLQGCSPNPWPLARELRNADNRRSELAADAADDVIPPVSSAGVVDDAAPLLTEPVRAAIRRDTGNVLLAAELLHEQI